MPDWESSQAIVQTYLYSVCTLKVAVLGRVLLGSDFGTGHYLKLHTEYIHARSVDEIALSHLTVGGWDTHDHHHASLLNL